MKVFKGQWINPELLSVYRYWIMIHTETLAGMLGEANMNEPSADVPLTFVWAFVQMYSSTVTHRFIKFGAVF